MENIQNITVKVQAFMSKSFEGAEVGADQDIFEAGFGSSMFAMQLVAFIEHEFDVEVDSDDLDIDNFKTATRVANLVHRKTQEVA
ncbi:MAG: methoxymalonate biosynthesis acyl carrier protein [Candidatus Azotimanducaceae bacterium]|jgi:methoxymalonate biosynthesis acyl carrier protein